MLTAIGIFCEACLADKPLDDLSPDPRYCQGCYDFLLKETELLPPKKHPAWIPKNLKAKMAVKNVYPISQYGVGIMHTIKGDKIQSVHNSSAAPINDDCRKKRGPKFRDDIPVDLIEKWANKGIGSKTIAMRLKRERDIKVHYSTIQRILKGQRLLV